MPKLYMLLIGASPRGRNIEQHDVFFGISNSIKEMVPEIIAFWPEAKDKIHLDAWREVTKVNEYAIDVISNSQSGDVSPSTAQLFFINLGGYKPNEFEEFHYKMIVAAPDKGQAIQQSKKTAFFEHTGFKGATSHVDDKYGVDVDDVFEIKDILSAATKQQYSLKITPAQANQPEDEIHLGYFKLDNVDKWETIRSDASAQKSSPE